MPFAASVFHADPVTGWIFLGGAQHAGSGAMTGFMQLSKDLGGSWLSAQNGWPDGGIVSAFSIPGPYTSFLYRFRLIGSRSFLLNDGSLGAGYVELEGSSAVDENGGLTWWPLQRFYEWPQINVPGIAPGQASMSFSAAHAFIPGSGPNGADADWLATRVFVTANPGPVVWDESALWRSDTFGYSWTKVRTIPISPVLGFYRAPWGRLFIPSGGNMFYSDDLGASWAGIAPPLILHTPTAHPGGAMSAARDGTLTGGGTLGVSCDRGASWQITQIIGQSNFRVRAVKVSPHELLAFSTMGDGNLRVWWSDNGGESAINTAALPLSGGYAVPIGVAVVQGHVFIVSEAGICAYSTDVARGSWTPRTTCPEATAKTATARGLRLCGASPVASTCE